MPGETVAPAAAIAPALGYLITALCTLIVVLVCGIFRKVGKIEETVVQQGLDMAEGFTGRPDFPECNKRKKELKEEVGKDIDDLEKEFKGHRHVKQSGEVILQQ